MFNEKGLVRPIRWLTGAVKAVAFFFLLIGICADTLNGQNVQGAVMYAATPNPTLDKCLVRLYLPRVDEKAEVRILNSKDSVIQIIPIPGGVGIQSAAVNLGGLPMGTYTCQLFYEGWINQSTLIYHQARDSRNTRFDSVSVFKLLTDLELKIKDLQFNEEMKRQDQLRLDSMPDSEAGTGSAKRKKANATIEYDTLISKLKDLNSDIVSLRQKIESFEDVMRELDALKLTKKAYDNPMKKGTTYSLTRIYFRSGNFDFLPKSKEELDDLASVLNEFPKLVIHIMGHSDNVGSYQANVELSQQRAKMVYNYLISKGIAANRLSYEGFGPDKPLTENITEQDRAANRRVEFVILKE